VLAVVLAFRLLDHGEEPTTGSRPTTSPSASPPSATTSTGGQGLGAPANGIDTDVTVLATGDLEVRQTIRSRAPLSSISIAPPSDPLVGDGVQASDLQVTAGGGPVPGPSSIDTSAVAFSFAGTHEVQVAYHLSGVLVPSASRPDRALARMTSLDLGFHPQEGSSTFHFEGATVLNLFCADVVGDQTPVPCGVRAGDAWGVKDDVPQGTYRVMALVQLSPETASGS